MPFFAGEIFVSEVFKKPVLDQTGEEIGKLKDIILGLGEPFPSVTALVATAGRTTFVIPWDQINLFNRRVISVNILLRHLGPASIAPSDILMYRDLMDKQIVDMNGAKLVRVNDLKLGDVKGKLCLVAVDIGLRGILRRLGLELHGEKLLSFFHYKLQPKLIIWHYVQTVEPKLSKLTLRVTGKVAQMHPADLAEIISEVSQKERAALFGSLDVETAAEALHELEPQVQVDIIGDMTTEQASDILELMPPDEAADVLGDLPEAKAQELINLMEKEEAEDVQELLEHEEDTAGGLMTTEFLAFPEEMTVEDAIKEMRLEAPDVETIYYLYIVDGQEHLAGVVSLKNLILARPEVKLKDIMKQPVKTLPLDAEQEDVAEFISKYNLLAAPVVDENRVMHGIVTVDDVMDFLLPPASRKKRRKL